jgi:hypothetical protein
MVVKNKSPKMKYMIFVKAMSPFTYLTSDYNKAGKYQATVEFIFRHQEHKSH